VDFSAGLGLGGGTGYSAGITALINNIYRKKRGKCGICRRPALRRRASGNIIRTQEDCCEPDVPVRFMGCKSNLTNSHGFDCTKNKSQFPFFSEQKRIDEPPGENDGCGCTVAPGGRCPCVSNFAWPVSALIK
jgi:hypothetical protein